MVEPHLFALAYLILDWAVRIAFIFGVSQGRLPSAARSWILFAIIFPIPAAFLFVLIGNVREPKWRKARFSVFDDQNRSYSKSKRAVGVETSLARLIRNTGGCSSNTAVSVQLIPDDVQFVERLITEIDHASTHIHVLVYIFANDDIGRQVISALARATQRGVTSRVLFDAMGSRPWRRDLGPMLDNAGVQWREIAPASFSLSKFVRYDLRNHRKLYSIDGKISFIGSQNLVASDFRKSFPNQELMVALTGGIVDDIESQFARDWYLETATTIHARVVTDYCGALKVQMLPTGPEFGVEGFPLFLNEVLYAAQSQFIIATPYLVPDDALLLALRAATAKGVKVRIFVSERMDQWSVGLAQRSYYNELMQMGVQLFAFREKLLHVKLILVDFDLVYVGSGNADIRSFRLNSEIGIVVSDLNFATDVAEIVDGYEADSNQIDPIAWHRRSIIQKLGENFLRLASPLL